MRWIGILLTATLAAGGCGPKLDTTRAAPERGTLGAEIYEVLCERMASEAMPNDVTGRQTRALCEGRADPATAPSPRLQALANNRRRLIEALDQAIPPDMHEDMNHFLAQIVPLYDPPEERLPTQTRAMAELIRALMEDFDAVDALERLGYRDGYRPHRLSLGLARPVMTYPELGDLTRTTLDTIEDGGAAAEPWQELLRAAALEMATAKRQEEDKGPATPPSTLEVTRGLLFRHRELFGGGGDKSFIAKRDTRGLVRVAGQQELPGPFVDEDDDGLADIDEETGRFVDGSGSTLEVPAPFPVLDGVPGNRDAQGRALTDDGSQQLYRYLETDRTLLAGLMRELPPMLEPESPALLDLAYGLPPLLGPETRKTHEYRLRTLSYPAFNTEESPLLDLVHGVGTLLDDEQTDDALKAARKLVRNHEQSVAKLLDTALYIDERADNYPDAELVQPNDLWDDVLRVAGRMAQQPGLMEAVLRALADPRTGRLDDIYPVIMRHKDRVSVHPDDKNRPRRDVEFTERVNRGRPDREGNRSIYERNRALFHDLNGVRICNKQGAYLTFEGQKVWPVGGTYDRCELVEIPNAAEFYVRSVLGRAELELKSDALQFLIGLGDDLGIGVDALLEDLSGIDGLTRHPTPEAIHRLLFTEHNEFLKNLFGPIETRDGVPVRERHPETAFALEKAYEFEDGQKLTFLDAEAPLMNAFDRHDQRENGRYLFGNLISVFHLHWPATYEGSGARTQDEDPDDKFYAHQSNSVSYEPLLADAFEKGRLLTRLGGLARALDGIQVRTGVDGIDAIAALAEKMLDPSRNGGLRDRQGRSTTTTNTGDRQPDLTPMYLVLDGLGAMDDAFAEADGQRHDRWLEARGTFVDQFLSVEQGPDGYRLKNRRGRAIILELVDFLRDRIAAHRQRGDLPGWATRLDDRLEETLNEPVVTALIRLLDGIQNDPDARGALADMLAYVGDPERSEQSFDTAVASVADILQLVEDDRNLVPLMQVLSNGFASNAQDAVASGNPLQVEGSTVDASVKLLRGIGERDEDDTLPRLLSNLVSSPEDGPATTPIETLLDVIAEVNRAQPGRTGPLDANDYRRTLDQTYRFVTNESRGLERLYRVIQERELD
jgi:hypothetical protein